MKHKLGIVLSGGDTRGVAHTGLLKALQPHGIRPDPVAGSSLGAIVGALFDAGYDAASERMDEIHRAIERGGA